MDPIVLIALVVLATGIGALIYAWLSTRAEKQIEKKEHDEQSDIKEFHFYGTSVDVKRGDDDRYL